MILVLGTAKDAEKCKGQEKLVITYANEYDYKTHYKQYTKDYILDVMRINDFSVPYTYSNNI